MTEGITVIIPAYGPGPHLEEVVTALDRQLDEGSRILISHSGSGDPTGRFATNPRVTVLHSSERLFAGAARNRALQLVTTEWVAFIDEDVVPGAKWHAALCQSIAADDADCILGAIDYRTSGGYWGVALWFIEFGSCHPYLARRPIKGEASCNMAVRRDAFRVIGDFPEGWRIGQDTVAHARLTEAGKRLMFDPTIVVAHHNPPGARHMVRHMFDHGIFSARVRREHMDLPGAAAVRWPLLSIGMWLARAVQSARRVMTARHGPKMKFVLHLPAILIGLAAWNLGFSREAFTPHGRSAKS